MKNEARFPGFKRGKINQSKKPKSSSTQNFLLILLTIAERRGVWGFIGIYHKLSPPLSRVMLGQGGILPEENKPQPTVEDEGWGGRKPENTCFFETLVVLQKQVTRN
jgi:hypothetical protein